MRGKIATLGLGMLAVAALPAFAAEGRIPIPFTSTYSTPIVISESGSYVVTRNLEPTGPGPIIEILNDKVDLDLNGMTLTNYDHLDDPLIRVQGLMSAKIHDGVLRGGLHGISGGAAVIEDVRISGSAGSGIHLVNSVNFLIRRNLIILTGGPAIHLEQPLVKAGTIENNEIRDCYGGIVLYVAYGTRISENRLTFIRADGVYDSAIYLEWTRGCDISGNVIHGDHGGEYALVDGIRLADHSRGSKVRDNLVSDIGGTGIRVSDDAWGSVIVDNYVNNAGQDGLYVGSHHANSIERNVLMATGYGIRFGASASGNCFGRNTAMGGGGPCAHPFSNALCDDHATPGTINVSFGDNLVPPSAGLF